MTYILSREPLTGPLHTPHPFAAHSCPSPTVIFPSESNCHLPVRVHDHLPVRVPRPSSRPCSTTIFPSESTLRRTPLHIAPHHSPLLPQFHGFDYLFCTPSSSLLFAPALLRYMYFARRRVFALDLPLSKSVDPQRYVPHSFPHSFPLLSTLLPTSFHTPFRFFPHHSFQCNVLYRCRRLRGLLPDEC